MPKRYLLLFLIFISCKKEVIEQSISVDKIKNTIETKHFKNSEYLKIDTLKLENLSRLNLVDSVLITTLKREYSKDSVGVAFFRLDFYNKNKIEKSIPINIKFGSDEGNWSVYEEVIKDKNSSHIDYRFFELTYGYDACGYIQSNFIFFIDFNKFQLIVKNESMSDGGYGTWTEFEPNFVENKIESFSSKTITIDSDDSKPYNDENEHLIMAYTDSIVYSLQLNRWIGKPQSQKNEIYRREFTTFDKLYKQD
jgi:hypothetical protein